MTPHQPSGGDEDVDLDGYIEAHAPSAPEEEAAERASFPELEKWLAEYHGREADDVVRFRLLHLAAPAAYRLGHFAEARILAERLLSESPRWKAEPMREEVLHTAHTLLGLLALRESDEASAMRELLLSADTPGGPALNSFGPNWQLARELIARGQRQAALAYLRRCRAFWKSGGSALDLWERMIREGKTPYFGGRPVL